MVDFREVIRERLSSARLEPTREAEIVDEMAQHLEDRLRDRLAAGVDRATAEAETLAELDGSDALVRELARVAPRAREVVAPGAARLGLFADVWRDLRYAARALRKTPGFTAVTVLSLALGVGANTALFQLLESLHLRPLPVAAPGELAIVQIANRTSASGTFRSWHADLSHGLWERIRDEQQVFSHILAYGDTTFNLAPTGQARYAAGSFVSGRYFETLGVSPALGRLIGPDDDVLGACPAIAVVGHGFWQRELGGEASALGRRLDLDGHGVEIIGVVEEGFFGLEVGRAFDIAVPICSEPALHSDRSVLGLRHGWWLSVIGRLKPGVTVEQASAHLAALSPAMFEATVPSKYDAARQERYRTYRLGATAATTGISALRKEYSTPLYLLLGTAALVLLIACANLASLLLARASAREREIAVRLALGASGRRLVRQLMVESLLLAFAGAAAGLLLATWLSGLVVALFDTGDKGLFIDLAPDWRVIGFTAALAVLTCLLFGLAPALRASRTDVNLVLKGAGGSSWTGLSRWGMRRLLVAVQVALSFVLLASALLFMRSFQKLAAVDEGFRAEGLLAVGVKFARAGIPEERRPALRQELLATIEAVPGVESAALAGIVPLSGDGWNEYVWVEGRDPEQRALVQFNRVSPGYFRTVDTRLVAGRDFDERDAVGAPPVAIVSQAFAIQLNSGEDPIGRRLSVKISEGKPGVEYEIVGVVADSKYLTLRERHYPLAYVPAAQDPEPGTFEQVIMRSSLPPAALTNAAEAAIAKILPGANLEFTVVDRMIRETLRRDQAMAALSGFFGFLAALLATLGLYGVVSYGVARRTHEIGIRVALGADRMRITRLILAETLGLLAVGLVAGLGLSLAVTRLAGSLLYGLSPHDPLTLAAAVALLGLVTFVAGLRPAQRAARVDPMVALRED